MSRQVDRKFRIWSLFEQGKLLKPDKVKIVYRYKENQSATAKLYLLGYVQDEASPRTLINGYPLTDSECSAERDMTEVIEVVDELKVSAMRILISNYEQLKDVHLIDAVYDVVDIPLGLKDDDGNFSCNSIFAPVATDGTEVSTTGFTANWDASDGATGYKLDIATDVNFDNMVLTDEDVGNFTEYDYSVSDSSYCYFYRVRSYNSDFESKNSNTIHVSYADVETECIKFGAVGHSNYCDIFLPDTQIGAKTKISFKVWFKDFAFENNNFFGVYWTTPYQYRLGFSVTENKELSIHTYESGHGPEYLRSVPIAFETETWYEIEITRDRTVPECIFKVDGVTYGTGDTSGDIYNNMYDTQTPQYCKIGSLTSLSYLRGAMKDFNIEYNDTEYANYPFTDVLPDTDSPWTIIDDSGNDNHAVTKISDTLNLYGYRMLNGVTNLDSRIWNGVFV